MTKQEILKAIENGESVWYPKGRTIKQIDLKNTHPIFNGYQIDIMIEDENGWHTEFYGIENLYKTKAEAEHYLHHANITRTETLPFLTWEEFEERKSLYFTDKQGKEYGLTRDVRWSNDENRTEYCLRINNMTDFKIVKSYGYSEANFYKAYDECVKLFKEQL